MVLADGCFDPLHCGHVAYLKAARVFGSVTVRIADDDTIFEKGRVPFQTQAERMVTVLALHCVDAVCTAPTLANAIKEYKPSHLIKGKDWEGKLPDDVIEMCHQMGTQIVFTPTLTRSSSERLAS